MRFPEPQLPGVFFNALVGPFKSKAECTAYMELMQRMFADFDGLQFKECWEPA